MLGRFGTKQGLRHALMMESAVEIEDLRARDLRLYGNPDGPTFEQLASAGQPRIALHTAPHSWVGWPLRSECAVIETPVPAQTIMPLIRPRFRACKHYSHLKAIRGSTLVARRAGSKPARSATATSNAATTRNVGKSVGFTSNRNFARTRVTAKAPATPSATPTVTRSRLRLKIMRVMSLFSAPNAMRIPISRVRSATAQARTPYTPIAAKRRASIAKIAIRRV